LWLSAALRDVAFDMHRSVPFGIANAIGDFAPHIDSHIVNM